VTITAELSDAFSSKKEGITIICQQLQNAFNSQYLLLINVNAEFVTVQQALSDYLSVSASNWIATSLVFGEKERMGLLLDMGSTTMDLIPIKEGKPVAIGKNDVDRLIHHELYYTGVLRPPIPTIVNSVPFHDVLCPISFERFALMADVYMILGFISEQEYSCDTADGRGKSIEECYSRLARIICADSSLVTKEEMDRIAEHIYHAHMKMVQDIIWEAIHQILRRFEIPCSDIHFHVTGLGAKTLLIPALKEMNIHENQIFFKSLTEKEHVVSTAICLGLVFLRREFHHILLSH
jgi:probable H4MPT-linked C1 transfer pathway protein